MLQIVVDFFCTIMNWFIHDDVGTTGLLWKFIIGSVPIIFGLPFIFVTGASLYSKLLPMQVQGEICRKMKAK